MAYYVVESYTRGGTKVVSYPFETKDEAKKLAKQISNYRDNTIKPKVVRISKAYERIREGLAKKWQIYFADKYMVKRVGKEAFQLEKFLTGGKVYHSFREAQDIKKSLQNMQSSFLYKVVRVDEQNIR